jgi:osmoprotectant transport system permease protein
VTLVRNRVLLLLVAGGAVAALDPAFLTQAPNRIVAGTGVSLVALHAPYAAALALPAALLVAGVFAPASRPTHVAVAAAATLLLAGIVALAGAQASALARHAPAAARVSLGGGFWLLALGAWLAAADALERLRLPGAMRIVAGAAVFVPVAALLAGGELADVSLLREYAARRDVFGAALVRHVAIVVAALLPTLAIGIPLGVAVHRRARWQGPVFALLNVIETVPSIALFGLLLAPLALLASAVPALARLGIGGIGMAPAVIALTLYSLLPVVRSTLAGLTQVPQAVVEAATGMGLTRGQVFRKVEWPLALPVLLAGVRIATVQAIGLTVVAALIGAGGLGALMFQGLASSALDLVLLGVVPVVALSLAADALFRLAAMRRAPQAG